MTLSRGSIELLKERDADDVVVFGGGIIPDDDIPRSRRLGVAKIFTPGATTTRDRRAGSRAARRAPRSPAAMPRLATGADAGRRRLD